jgi:hypothetical protein
LDRGQEPHIDEQGPAGRDPQEQAEREREPGRQIGLDSMSTTRLEGAGSRLERRRRSGTLVGMERLLRLPPHGKVLIRRWNRAQGVCRCFFV